MFVAVLVLVPHFDVMLIPLDAVVSVVFFERFLAVGIANLRPLLMADETSRRSGTLCTSELGRFIDINLSSRLLTWRRWSFDIPKRIQNVLLLPLAQTVLRVSALRAAAVRHTQWDDMTHFLHCKSSALPLEFRLTTHLEPPLESLSQLVVGNHIVILLSLFPGSLFSFYLLGQHLGSWFALTFFAVLSSATSTRF